MLCTCRPYTSKVAKITEDVDFGIVEDAELGQQVYQVSTGRDGQY